MRVALIHYWLVNMRGGEKVLESLCSLFPHADIYTHTVAPAQISDLLKSHHIFTTFIDRLPAARKHYQMYLPFMPIALEQLDLRGYDLVISSESGPAKGVLTNANTPHICYCHSPMRYLWDFYQDYLQQCCWLKRQIFKHFAHKLRLWDLASASRVDHFIANSNNVAARIRKCYRREAEVIHPPVDIEAFSSQLEPVNASVAERPYIIIGQLVRYKAVHIAVEAFNTSGRRLLIVGTGEEEKRLRNMARANIHFAGKLSDEDLRKALWSSRALVFPGEEDFGIVPLEAMSAGKPVIAYGHGGALETVQPGISGVFFYSQTPAALNAALDEFESQEAGFSATTIQKSVQPFSRSNFENKLHMSIERILSTWESGKKLLK